MIGTLVGSRCDLIVVVGNVGHDDEEMWAVVVEAKQGGGTE